MTAAEQITSALDRSPLVGELRRTLGDCDGIWLVGGSVRDVLLGGEVGGDIDLAVSADPKTLARSLARELRASPFQLSAEFGSWRVTGPDGSWTIDLTPLRADSIEGDLHLRDFTANAIAVPLGGGAPIDPTGGISDTSGRILRACSDASFEDDPLRLLRACRFAAGFGFSLVPETIELARGAATRASEPAGERRLAELKAIVGGPDPIRALELMEQTSVMATALPELHALRGVGQSANHHLDVYDHTIEVMRRWLEIEADLGSYCGEFAPEVERALAEPLADELTRREGIRFAAILHDIGKPATRTEKDGFVGFRGHDVVGAEMVGELFSRLRASRRLGSFVANLTLHHLVLGFMVKDRPLPRRRVWDYLSRTGSEALDVTLLTCADRLSARGGGVPEAAIEGHLELAREMIGEIVALERNGAPDPLLTGGEIAAELGLSGAAIGEAVGELAAAQFAGEVETREQALEHLSVARS